MKVNIIKYFTIVGDCITLGQFLKEESVVSSGGQAKFYLQDNPVTLNGALENRRGKKIRVGDHLLVNGQEYEFRREE
ncbi:RNA-binding protein [Lactobacillus sp. UMNPBX6]|nr:MULTISPECIES: S4 domain-containing protein YaaA [Lactobacillus]PEG81514.1 RNA-binding protein [Lactobacillus sp. UMNPBX17]PEG87491.1 RNA-binding protein [Lactobacillus sp. UMNPBX14]PEH03040.1 RNA-binding protein [Lactobacillus sp. UMNPBX6]PEH06322.1 RNA-binding protein [Lactobacillus sp. UMNPBX4]